MENVILISLIMGKHVVQYQSSAATHEQNRIEIDHYHFETNKKSGTCDIGYRQQFVWIV